MIDGIFKVAGMIVILGVVATVVSHGSDSANIIRSWGSAFSSSITAAKGA